jgi:hypothetical protein
MSAEDFSIPYHQNSIKDLSVLEPGLRIRVHCIRIRMQHFLKVSAPEPNHEVQNASL